MCMGLGFGLTTRRRHRGFMESRLCFDAWGDFAYGEAWGARRRCIRALWRGDRSGGGAVVACSYPDLELFKTLSPGNLTIIENGVDTGKLALADAPGRVAERFLFVGALTANKNLEAVIRTFAAYLAVVPAATLHVVGDDWQGLVPELERLAMSLQVPRGRVVFRGVVSERELRRNITRRSILFRLRGMRGLGFRLWRRWLAGRLAC